MILDQELKLSWQQPITNTAASTNVIDAGAEGDAYCKPLWFVAHVRESFAGAGTLNIQLQTADNETFNNAKVMFDSGALSPTQLTAGENSYVVKVRTPLGALQYLRANYVVNGGAMTAGSIDTFFADEVTAQAIYGVNPIA